MNIASPIWRSFDKLEAKQDAQQKNMKDTVERMVKESISKVYDQQMISDEELAHAEKLRELKTNMLEKNAGEKYQKEKELMNQISDISKASGKSFVEVMADLLKSSTVKTKQQEI